MNKTILGAVFALAMTAGGASAVTLSLENAGEGTDAILESDFSLDRAAVNAEYVALTDGFGVKGTSVTTFTAAQKNAGNGLSVNGAATVTFTYLGFEARDTNLAAFIDPATPLFVNRGADASALGDTATVSTLSGLLAFLFESVNGDPTGVGTIANDGGATPGTATSLKIAYQLIGPRSALVFFDDSLNDPDFDDLGLRIDVAPIPLPASMMLLATGLIGLALLRRRALV